MAAMVRSFLIGCSRVQVTHFSFLSHRLFAVLYEAVILRTEKGYYHHGSLAGFVVAHQDIMVLQSLDIW